MAVIKLVEDYSVRQLRRDVRDSLSMTGEQAILLQMFHPNDADAVPCVECGDDLYKSGEENCLTCYGTMYEGGIRQASLVWALFTDHQIKEQLGPRGVYEADQRHVQLEGFPLVAEHDIIVRIRRWNAKKPLEIEGYYLLQTVDRRSLRTGNRFGQYSWDVVGQKAQIAELPTTNHGVTTYPIIGKTFVEASDLQIPPTPTVP